MYFTPVLGNKIPTQVHMMFCHTPIKKNYKQVKYAALKSQNPKSCDVHQHDLD